MRPDIYGHAQNNPHSVYIERSRACRVHFHILLAIGVPMWNTRILKRGTQGRILFQHGHVADTGKITRLPTLGANRAMLGVNKGDLKMVSAEGIEPSTY
jgi:hypothetical protein